MARQAAASAEQQQRDVAEVQHGGDVPNAYRYPAVTDAVSAVALWPERIVVVDAAELAANKVTRAGAAAATLGGFARPMWDARFGDESTTAARAEIFRSMRQWLSTADVPGCLALSSLRLDMHAVALLRAELADVRASRDHEIARRKAETAPSEDTVQNTRQSRWAALEIT